MVRESREMVPDYAEDQICGRLKRRAGDGVSLSSTTQSLYSPLYQSSPSPTLTVKSITMANATKKPISAAQAAFATHIHEFQGRYDQCDQPSTGAHIRL